MIFFDEYNFIISFYEYISQHLLFFIFGYMNHNHPFRLMEHFYAVPSACVREWVIEIIERVCIEKKKIQKFQDFLGELFKAKILYYTCIEGNCGNPALLGMAKVSKNVQAFSKSKLNIFCFYKVLNLEKPVPVQEVVPFADK